VDGRDQKYPVTRKTLRTLVEDVSLQSQTWKYFFASRVTIYALNDCVWRLEVGTTSVLYVHHLFISLLDGNSDFKKDSKRQICISKFFIQYNLKF
jgi:hypothetical protein